MATSSLYLFTYNNYMNKIVKKSDTLQGYGKPMVTLRNTQFNPNDHIRTSHIFNTFSMDERGIPDYCVVCDASDKILSRWYVIDVSRTRGGQWKVQLLADLAADYLSEMMDATCFIQKGYTNSSPFVFNNENMGFNQIKTDEIPLANKLNTPWLVLYLARYQNAVDEEGGNKFNKFTGIFYDAPATNDADYVLDSLNDYKYFYYSENTFTCYDPDTVNFGTFYQLTGDVAGDKDTVYLMLQKNSAGDSGFSFGMPYTSLLHTQYPRLKRGRILYGSTQNWTDMNFQFKKGISLNEASIPINSYTNHPILWTQSGGIVVVGPKDIGTPEGYAALIGENGKKIKIGDEIYRIDVRQATGNQTEGAYEISPNSALGKAMRASFFYYNGLSNIPTNVTQRYFAFLSISYPSLSIRFIKIGAPALLQAITYDIEYTQSITKDAAYEIIAAPYNTLTFNNVPGEPQPFRHNGDIALQWFQAIINKYKGANFAYDLQLVPYCPIDTDDLSTQSVVFCKRIGESGANLALAIQLETSSFSYFLALSRFPWNENVKLSNELDIYRLVSPNGVGEYEWSPTKNGDAIGSLPAFEVDCTLIPFQPYIKINPFFGGLYGRDFNDYRGLICGGDFSFPIVTNEWETYKLNNKYYQDIFDRGIKHQEFNNKFALISDTIGAGVRAIQGASQGALAGGMVGGLPGALVGGIGGALTSAAGGVFDVFINKALREENISYQKDLFGMELGTIKARSESLSRTTSFNRNNKYFPYIEYYTCTEAETTALKNKMQYNGMTIGAIGKIEDYLNNDIGITFVQGMIIEIDIIADAAIVDRLNQILQGGIRIQHG